MNEEQVKEENEKTPAKLSPGVVSEALKNLEGAVKNELDPPLKFIEKQDLLEAENLQLRVMNLSLHEQALIQDLSRMRAERTELQKKLLDHREYVAKKYDINFDECEIRSGDGAVLPTGSTPPGLIR